MDRSERNGHFLKDIFFDQNAALNMLLDDLGQRFFIRAAIPDTIRVNDHHGTKLTSPQTTHLGAFDVDGLFAKQFAGCFVEFFAVTVTACTKKEMAAVGFHLRIRLPRIGSNEGMVA